MQYLYSTTSHINFFKFNIENSKRNDRKRLNSSPPLFLHACTSFMYEVHVCKTKRHIIQAFVAILFYFIFQFSDFVRAILKLNKN